jgi:ADP-dependent NAD(P)H-hydrate dehydratase / NAD(P)H-hydrate epimerase
MIPILSPAEAAAWDAAAEADGRPLRMLMETAGREVARVVMLDLLEELDGGVVVACGPGNNGGDGWVAAAALHRARVPVWVVEAGTPRDGSPAADARRVALADGVRTLSADGPWPDIALVVDALLGTGARGAPREPIASLVERLRDLEVPILAVDGPTGLDLETGVHHYSLSASISVTFGGLRRGHLLGRDDVGEVIVTEIGHPAPPATLPVIVADDDAAGWLPEIPADAHKGVRGRVVLVGGSPEMLGAIRLAARAAFASGAGLVHVIVPPDAASDLRTAEPDVQVRATPFDTPLPEDLVALIARADAVAIGPGLGRGPGREAFVAAVLGATTRAVVDADALVALSGEGRAALMALAADRELVITPHAGEFARLVPEHAGALETDPWSAAIGAADLLGATVLLKGVPTVIAQRGAPALTVATGNPGLATGGSGDILTGIIATMLAQGLPTAEAAALGAWAMGDAADDAVEAEGVGTRGLRPMHVVEALPAVWQRLAMRRDTPRPRIPFALQLPPPYTDA